MIFLILFLALALRLFNLNQSLWLDEAVQAVVAKNSFAFAFEELKGDFHPPLFHLLMHFWVRVFGASEIILRIPSVLFGVGAVFVVYLIAKSYNKTRSQARMCLIAALLMATAPFHIYYSQEARMYSMVTFFSSLSMYCFIKLLTSWSHFVSPSAGLRKDEQVNELKRFPIFNIQNLLFVLSTTLALYSDYYAILVILAQIIAGIIILRKKIIKLMPYFIVIWFLFLPVLPLLMSQLKTGMEATAALPAWGKLVNLSFIKALPLTFIKFSFGRITFFNKELYSLLVLGVAGVLGGIGGYGFIKVLKSESLKVRKSGRENYLIVFLWLVVPVLAAWLLSLVIPNYQPFRLLLVLPAFYLLLAYGASAISNRIVCFLAVILVLLINMCSSVTYYQNPYFWREDWRGASQFIKTNKLKLIISAEAFNWPLVYYGVDDKVVAVAKGAGIITQSNFKEFKTMVSDEKELCYTRYLADLYDPQNFVPKWLTNLGFVKIKEVSYNQIPLWIYQHENRN